MPLVNPTTQGNLTGDVTSVGLATTAAATQANIATLSKASGVAVHGTNTNDAGAAAYVGEYVESVISSYTNFSTSTQYGDLTSISLTAGDWDVSLVGDCYGNSAAVTLVNFGISITSGNSSTGLVNGSNSVYPAPPGTTGDSSGAISAYRMSLSGTTTVYFKYRSSYSVATPQAVGRLSARRVR